MSSGFVTEAEIAEQKRIRQEEWEKVRTADQPIDAPEEPYDGRSLFDKLQDQKNKRDMEYEEAHKLKNMIRGLDDDEVEFLDLVDQKKIDEERKKKIEEENEMRDFKKRVASLQEKTLDERLKQELKKPQCTSKNLSGSSGRISQQKLLAGVVIKKQQDKTTTTTTTTTDNTKGLKRKLTENEVSQDCNAKECKVDDEKNNTTPIVEQQSGLKCIGILPGLGSYYDDSSDSDCSSDSEHEHGHINKTNAEK
ncbi:PSME3-interacting protein isoform X2 [Aphidius gifuensis]|uniref:PSME3-interacting protein isoform X2 n=1 Tax=Aphidius gifuensis TaxID=684658 RepID=UPI001CDD70C6|nr:PSME3-interacting protein isoform X2 [Aphidius gifuensis]